MHINHQKSLSHAAIRFSKSLLCVVVISSAHHTASWAATCEDLVVPEITKIQTDDRLQYSFYNSINDQNFNTYATNGALSVLAPNFAAQDKRNAFYEWRKSYNQNTKYSYSSSDISSYFATRFSAAGGQAYIECLQKPGLKLIPSIITDKSVTVILRYRTEVAGSKAYVGAIESPDTGEKKDLPKPIAVNGETVASFTSRNKEEDMSFIVQGYTDDPKNPAAQYTYTATLLVPKNLKVDEGIKPPKIVVKSVSYSDPGGAGCNDAALNKVRLACDQQPHCEIARDYPFLCGGSDPAPTRGKNFSGSFECGSFGTKEFGNGGKLALTCSATEFGSQ